MPGQPEQGRKEKEAGGKREGYSANRYEKTVEADIVKTYGFSDGEEDAQLCHFTFAGQNLDTELTCSDTRPSIASVTNITRN